MELYCLEQGVIKLVMQIRLGEVERDMIEGKKDYIFSISSGEWREYKKYRREWFRNLQLQDKLIGVLSNLCLLRKNKGKASAWLTFLGLNSRLKPIFSLNLGDGRIVFFIKGEPPEARVHEVSEAMYQYYHELSKKPSSS